MHEYQDGPRLVPTTPHVITGESLPCTLGHEISGTITELGPGVSGFNVGDRVVIETVIADGTCYGCSLHTPGLCSKRGFIGYSGYGGGFAESICVPSKSVFSLPDSISMEVGALVEPLAVAWHAVKVSGVKNGETALILGGGDYISLSQHEYSLIRCERTDWTRCAIMFESFWRILCSSFRDLA